MSIKALPRKTLFTSILLANALLGASSYAGPQGGNITHGSGSIGTQGNTTSILQNSNQLMIDWNSFNVNSNETVNFHQPGASSVALNNILQYDASRINGQINANGQVILINPRGLIFGSGAEINTAGLIVSSLSIAKKSFLNGEFAFKDLDDSQGVIINNGAIHASSGGITLLGESVINNGIIQAELGYINLAAGKQAFLSFDEQGFLGVKIDQDVINNELGLEQAIENNGELSAGGRVAISAKVTSGLFDRAINNTGMIRATGFNLPTADESPSISLNSNGDINNSGTLDVSNHQTVSNNNTPVQTNGGQVVIEGKQIIHTGIIDVSSDFGKGGKVDILGDQVGLAGVAIVNADGEQGGGDIQIGGSYQGKDSQVKNAEATYVGEGTKISANAGTTGDGGDIVVWADNTTRYYGDIEAKGGSESGNGGDVEVSGKQNLSFDGSVDTSAENGLSGELLLDPATLTIVGEAEAETPHTHVDDAIGQVTFDVPEPDDASIKASTVVNLLETNNVRLTATDSIIVDSAIDTGFTGTLELFSNGNINVNQLIRVGGRLVLEAEGTVAGTVGDTAGTSGIINLVAGLSAETITLTGLGLTGSGTIDVGSSLNISEIEIAGGIKYSGLVTGSSASLVSGTNANNNTFDLNAAGFKISDASFQGFTDVNSGSEGTVNGSLIADSFAITGDQSVLVNGTTFSNITTVNAKTNTNTEHLDSVSGSATWGLSENGFTANQINFVDVETADSGSEGTVNGSLIADSFEITGDQSVLVNGTTFNNITTVNAQANTNAEHLDSVSGSTTWDLLSTGFKANEISFIDVETANSGSEGIVNGSLVADSFVIKGSKSVLVSGTTFTNVTVVNGSNGSDDVQSDSSDWTIQGAEATSIEGIAFSDIESINKYNSASISDRSLAGTAGEDFFTAAGSNAVSANGITYYGIGTVNAGDGDDDIQSNSVNWTIQGTEETSIDGITFSDVETINKNNSSGITNRNLNGTTGQDLFNIENTNIISADGITYYGIGTVDALGETDTVSGSTAWDLLAGGFKAFDISFANVEIANSGAIGTLNGTSSQDLFTIKSNQSVDVNGITFNQVTTVNAGDDNADTVTGLSGQAWTIENEGFSASQISFIGTEKANSLSGGSVTGTDQDESFETTYVANQVVLSDYTFDGIATVNALGHSNTDSLFTNNSMDESFIINANEQIIGNGITFSNFEDMVGEAGDSLVQESSQFSYNLDLNAGVYTFVENTTAGTSNITNTDYTIGTNTDKVSFNGLSTSGTETFFLEKVGEKYQVSVLVGGEKKVTSEQFLSLLSVDGIDSNDTFIFDSTASLDSSINFNANTSLFTSTLSGAASATEFSHFKIYDLSQLGNDLAIGFTSSVAATLSLINGTNNQFSFSGIEFYGFNNVNSTSGLLNTITGSDQADSFSAISGNELTANGIAFNDIATVNAGLGDDDIEHGLAVWAIQAANNATTVESINFTGIDTINKNNSIGITNRNLNGTTGQDLLNIVGTNTINANGITYYGIGTVDALGNSEADLDMVSGSTTWDLLANGFKAFGISFTSVETASSGAAGILNGTTAADKFVVAGTQSVA
ncbi:MAG: filamentous hemagglutinin N-terminal domain-containing protein, partial [Oleispira antarctica]|nr:filamentous hemagglutinin N-terminal domain-containing protein [Oleispira antarctica]MBQ0793610.1 filamentous hemagglutinin N-terminal domain-containing protein [Oleispira antarctica]